MAGFRITTAEDEMYQKVNVFVTKFLFKLKEGITNIKLKDGRLIDFFSKNITLGQIQDLIKILDRLEKEFPSELGDPVITKDINESSKVTSVAPYNLVKELEQVSGIKLNKKNLSKASPIKKRVIKPREKLNKKKTLFGRCEGTVREIDYGVCDGIYSKNFKRRTSKTSREN